jgi:hypothetical protein
MCVVAPGFGIYIGNQAKEELDLIRASIDAEALRKHKYSKIPARQCAKSAFLM